MTDSADDGTKQNKCTTGSQAGPAEAKLDNPAQVRIAYSGAQGFLPSDEKTVSYNSCDPNIGGGGAIVFWYDATNPNSSTTGTVKVQSIGIGGQPSTTSPSTISMGCQVGAASGY